MRTHTIHKQRPLYSVNTKQPAIKQAAISKLTSYFEKLDSDLEIGIAVALSYKFNCSCPDIFAAYEAWQVSDWNDSD